MLCGDIHRGTPRTRIGAGARRSGRLPTSDKNGAGKPVIRRQTNPADTRRAGHS